MAIEKIILDSAQDVADVINSLGWFDSVTVENTTVKCTKDSIVHLLANVGIQGGTASTGLPGAIFHTKGNGNVGNRTVGTNYNTATHKHAVKTKNGIIFARSLTVDANYYCWMLAKTTNDKIAVVVPNGNGYSSYGGQFQVAAIGETSPYVATGIISLCKQGVYPTNGSWEDATQIIGCPIPTHPLSGTSTIKNGIGFVLCPPVSFGSMMLNGTEYATNGILALSDED